MSAVTPNYQIQRKMCNMSSTAVTVTRAAHGAVHSACVKTNNFISGDMQAEITSYSNGFAGNTCQFTTTARKKAEGESTNLPHCPGN
jgi:hypothetical protein